MPPSKWRVILKRGAPGFSCHSSFVAVQPFYCGLIKLLSNLFIIERVDPGSTGESSPHNLAASRNTLQHSARDNKSCLGPPGLLYKMVAASLLLLLLLLCVAASSNCC
jgi:hypothetical protein